MTETKEDIAAQADAGVGKASKVRPWMYIVAALAGSLVGAGLDVLLYRDGGSMFAKIGLVAGPLALFFWSKRGGKEDDPS
jgi:hypothetical protein